MARKACGGKVRGDVSAAANVCAGAAGGAGIEGRMWRELDRLITETAALETLAGELDIRIKDNRERIVEMMKLLDVRRRSTAGGDEAVLYEASRYEWDAKKLAGVLCLREMDEFCPRRPDTSALRKLMEIDAARAGDLRKCARVERSLRLKLSRGRKDSEAAEAKAGAAEAASSMGGAFAQEADGDRKAAGGAAA